MKALFSSLLLTLAAVQAALSQSPTPTPYANPLDTSFRKILAEIGEAREVVNRNYVKAKLDQTELTAAAMHSTLTALDPHSAFLDPKAAIEMRAGLNAQYFGIGSSIRDLRDGEGMVIGTFIRESFRGGPAEKAGLRFGDMVAEIDGVSMRGKSVDEVRSHMLGVRGTKVVIVVERDGTKVTNEIVRDAIPTPAIPDAYMIRPGIGYVAMTNGVSRTLHSEFVAALAKLRASGMRSLILDIRNNSGGYAAQACNVAAEFLPRPQPIFAIKGRATNASSGCSSAKENTDVETPIVLMVNRGTVSAAEFLASALQDTDRAYLVGENTFGKGMLQSVYELEGGTRMHLTTSRFIGATGRMPQRDYSDGSLYRYYRNDGGPSGNGPAFKTKAGRDLYSGHGITPDEVVAYPAVSERIARFRGRLNDPVFAFVRSLVSGRVAGFENYRIDHPAVRDHDLRADEIVLTPQLAKAFAEFAVKTYKLGPDGFVADREYVERRLRTEMIVAAYAAGTAQRFLDAADDQLLKAIAAVPKAKELLDKFHQTNK